MIIETGNHDSGWNAGNNAISDKILYWNFIAFFFLSPIRLFFYKVKWKVNHQSIVWSTVPIIGPWWVPAQTKEDCLLYFVFPGMYTMDIAFLAIASLVVRIVNGLHARGYIKRPHGLSTPDLYLPSTKWTFSKCRIFIVSGKNGAINCITVSYNIKNVFQLSTKITILDFGAFFLTH